MVDQKPLFVLDTNMVTYVVTGKSSAARSRYTVELRRSRIAISAVTQGEILFGLAKNPLANRKKSQMQEFLADVECLHWNCLVTEAYGQLRANLEAAGALPSPLDLMIAGHASALNAVLVTHDQALKRLSGQIIVEDWADDL